MVRLRPTPLASVVVFLLVTPMPAHADIIITQNNDATALAAALVAAPAGTGIMVTGSTLSGHEAGAAMSSGTYALTGPLPDTYGLQQPGIVLSTGNVSRYATGMNNLPDTSTSFESVFDPMDGASPAQKALLDPITGASFKYFDVTQLDITFDVLPGFSAIKIEIVFGSEEYSPVESPQNNDGFGLYLNGVNIALVSGLPVNVLHPAMAAISGTELDGVLAPNLNPLLVFTAPVVPGSIDNLLTIILGDTSDTAGGMRFDNAVRDTTVYLSSLVGVSAQPPDPDPAVVPEPGTFALFGLGLLGLIGYGQRYRDALA
jgi:hypothetical protein